MYEYHKMIFYFHSPKSCILSDKNMAIISIRSSIIGEQYNQVRL